MNKGTKNLTAGEKRAIANRIVQKLFLVGRADQKADRLVVVDKDNKDLGGWCEGSVKYQIVAALTEFFDGD